MSETRSHEQILRDAVAELNRGNLSAYLSYYDPGCVFHGYPPEFSPDLDGVTGFYREMGTGFPRMLVTLDDVISSDDRVACRYTVRGTHHGPIMGLAPTGREVAVEGITIIRLSGGKFVERWQRFDELGLLAQLGALPMGPPS